jgi:curli biogenesis system outer membrane secretion channel CsgG
MSRHSRAARGLLVSAALCLPAAPALAQDLDQSIHDLAKQLYDRMAATQVNKVAVVEFPDLNGYQSALGQFIAEELITSLSLSAQPGQFDVVERRLLARVLREQELTDSSLFDAESISRIGKILGIEALVTGSLADLGTEVKVNARAISVESAKVFAAASVKLPKTEAVMQLMKQNAGSPAGVAPAVTSPARSLRRAAQ